MGMTNHTLNNTLIHSSEVKGSQYRVLLLGLLTYIVFEYIRFGAWIPSIEALHLQRLIAVATLAGFILFYRERVLHTKPLIAFLAIIVLSTLANIDNLSRARALSFFTTTLKITAVYYLIANLLLTKDNFRKFIVVYLTVNFILVLLGVMAGGGQGALSSGLFVGGFASDSNDYALAINTILPFFWFLFVFEKRPFLKTVYGAAFLLSLIAVIYTFSRGGFMGLSAIMLFMLLSGRNRVRNISLLVATVLFASYFTPASYWDKMRTITEFEEQGTRSTSQMRLNLWKIGLVMTARNPVLGVGPLNSGFQIVKYGTDVIDDESELYYLSGRFTHNTFISVSSELGLPGLIFFLVIIVTSYKNAIVAGRQFKRNEGETEPWLLAMPYAIMASLIGYSVTSFFITSYHYPHLYLVSALSVALRYHMYTDKTLPAFSEVLYGQGERRSKFSNA